MVRRGFKIAGVVSLLLLLGLAGLRTLDGTSRGVNRMPRIPGLARVDTPDDDEPALVRRAEDGRATVLCRIDGPGEPGRLRAVAAELGDHLDDAVDSTTSGRDLVLSLQPGLWQIVWYEPTGPSRTRTHVIGSFDLEEGEVQTCVLEHGGFALHGRVVDPKGRPVANAEVMGCGVDGPSAEDGTFSGTVPLHAVDGGGGCDLRARWGDGMLSRYGEIVWVTPFDAHAPVELVIDPSPVAGLGVSISATEDGVRVNYVNPGTPADRAGLLDGDLIATIDGTPTRGMSVWDFIAHGTGAEGSVARLEIVGDDGQRETVTIRRERLAQPSDP